LNTNLQCIKDIQQQFKLKPLKTLKVQKKGTLVSAAVGTTRHHHALEVRTVYGRSGNVLKNDKAVPNLSKLNYLVKKIVKVFI
jgi:hypothetical protein